MTGKSPHPTNLNGFLHKLRQWRDAHAWLTDAAAAGNVPHGINDDRRWAEIDGERFTEDDISWLRRLAVIESIQTVEGRTTWREWPDICDRPEGPHVSDRVEEIRIGLRIGDSSHYYLYCIAATVGRPEPIGTCELRTFRNEEDPTPPTDATQELCTTSDEEDDLSWLATLTIREHLPLQPTGENDSREATPTA